MITYLMLGQHGRLGNQMFQYAMLTGVSKKNNFLMSIPKQNHLLSDCFDIQCKIYDFNLNYEKIIKNLNYYREKYFHFNENIFTLSDNVVYSGNFQSEKYFSHCEDEIRKQFTFKKHIFDKSNEYISDLKNKYNKKIIATHIRRGDYLAHTNSHPIPDIEWYKKCFERFNKDESLYLIFSDDISWCKNNFSKLEYNFEYSNLTSHFEDLCAMSLCDHNIIANSSFSWWGAWLNKKSDKLVIAPKKWFGPFYFYHKTHDLYCKGWEVI